MVDEDKDEQEDEPALCIHYPNIMLCFIDHAIHSTTKAIEHSFDYPKTNVFRWILKVNSTGKPQLTKEKTGTPQISLYNAETKKSVDGWFLNFFPFQYFTTIKNEIFETEFPFTVPNDYKGKFSIELVAKVDSIKDSMRIDIPTYIKQ